jgi:putative ABC transport system permease protein
VRRLILKLFRLFRRDAIEQDLAREIAAHLAIIEDEYQRRGMTPADARRLARINLGGIEQTKERHREARALGWLDDGWRDLRHSARLMGRQPLFASTVVVILAIGIGLNLAFFQVLNVTVLRPQAVANPDALVRFDRIAKLFRSNGIPYPATQFIREHNDALTSVLTWSGAADDVVWGDDTTDRVPAAYVSANWFSELGYGAARGRVFLEAVDERADAPPVIVVSDRFWRSRLQSAQVVGQVVRVNNHLATIVGVAPSGFPGLRLEDPQVWLLIHQMDYFNPGMAFKDDWGSSNTHLYARLRPGIPPAAARDALQSTVRELAHAHPADFQPDEILQPYSARNGFRSPNDQRELRTIALLAAGLTLLVLLVACANLSNLILSRAIGRLREFSVRVALGATRRRIVRLQLAESLLLAACGALGGVLLGGWGARSVAAYSAMPGYLDFTPDWRTAVVTCAIALLATVAFGLVPAWMVSRRDLVRAIKDGGQQLSRGLARAPVRLVLVGLQVAGCCVLLVVAAAMVRGLQRTVTGSLGFEFEQVAVLDASLTQHGIRNEAARHYWTEVKSAVAAASPELEQMALSSLQPMGTSANRSQYNDAPGLAVTTTKVEPSFFPLLRIPILAGRNFQPDDRAALAVIISRRLAVEMYGTPDVVGKGFPRSNPQQTIVGVAGDAALIHVAATNVAEQYAPIDPADYADVLLLARSRNSSGRLLSTMRDAARIADDRVLPRLFLPADQLQEKVRARKLASLIGALVGLLALSLACFGIFGVVAYSAAMRTKEMGIRLALGAGSGSLTALLLRQLALPLFAGMLAGSLAGVRVVGLLEGEPFYLPALDATAPAMALTFFAAVAAIAALVPTWRALGADPLHALRHE